MHENKMCWRISCSRGRTLVNDGQALVMSIGRPQMSHTFEDFTTVFLNVVHQYGLPFTRIDVVFDRYDRLSIKEGTRTNSKKGKPIHRVKLLMYHCPRIGKDFCLTLGTRRTWPTSSPMSYWGEPLQTNVFSLLVGFMRTWWCYATCQI